MRNVFFKLFLACMIAILSPLFMITPLNANCVYCVRTHGGRRDNCGGPACTCTVSCRSSGTGILCPTWCNREERTCSNGCGGPWTSQRTRSVNFSWGSCSAGSWSGWSSGGVTGCNILWDNNGPNPDNRQGNCSIGGNVRRSCLAGEAPTCTFYHTGERRDEGTGDMIYSICGNVSCR